MGFFDSLFGKKPPLQPLGATPSEQLLFSLQADIVNREVSCGYASLSSAERVFYCVWMLEAEVNNGGFEQFFGNTAGDIAEDVPAALRAIGAGHTAVLVEQANAVFGPAGPPADWDAREDLIAEFDDATRERLDELDQAFYEYRDNLSELLTAYMKANAA